MQRTFQKLKLQYDKNFTIEYGTVNKKNPEIIYINYKTYISSVKENNEYNKIINDIFRYFKRKVTTEIIKSRFDKDFIFDYDILQDIKPQFKNKILTFELFLKQPNNDIKKISMLKGYISELSNKLIENLSNTLEKNNIKLSKVKS